MFTAKPNEIMSRHPIVGNYCGIIAIVRCVIYVRFVFFQKKNNEKLIIKLERYCIIIDYKCALRQRLCIMASLLRIVLMFARTVKLKAR